MKRLWRQEDRGETGRRAAWKDREGREEGWKKKPAGRRKGKVEEKGEYTRRRKRLCIGEEWKDVGEASK